MGAGTAPIFAPPPHHLVPLASVMFGSQMTRHTALAHDELTAVEALLLVGSQLSRVLESAIGSLLNLIGRELPAAEYLSSLDLGLS